MLVMSSMRRWRILALCFAAMVILLSPAVWAQGLEEAKAQGYIGERVDGYLGIVDAGAPSYVPVLVDQINSERQQSYAGIAQKQGVETPVVAQIAGEKLIARAKPGDYVLGADGVWRQK